jgi:predicted outer membrane repeat protein
MTLPSFFRSSLYLGAFFALAGCGDPATGDFDKDGLVGAEDCNDSDPNVGGPLAWYTDSDSDGYGDIDSEVFACSAPAGTLSEGGDCDDDSLFIHPGATEICDDLDNDCDGVIDQDATDAIDWYADLDEDTYGDVENTSTSCTQPDGHVEDSTDCDDADPLIYPGAEETYYDGIDGNCDPSDEFDADGDGDDSSNYGGTDCDDQNVAIYGAAPEICDGFDNDCNATTTEEGIVSVGSQVFIRIQDGIDVAVAGDTVSVCDGAFFESLTIDEAISLRSLNGPTKTTISAANTGGAPVVVNASDALISGFTITGGEGNPSAGMDLGGGVHFTDAAGALTIEASDIVNNFALRGAGIYSAGTLTLDDVTVSGNLATEWGGGIGSEGGLLLRDSSIEGNEATDGAGVYLFSPSGLVFALSMDSSSSVNDNAASDMAGGVYLCTDCNLDGGAITSNTADQGAGLFVEGTSFLNGCSISGAQITNNIAVSAGGGIFLNGGVDLQSTTIDQNEVTKTDGEGGGVYLQNGTLTMTGGSVIKGNKAALGGGVYAAGAGIDGGVIDSNTATDSGGGIYMGTDMGSSFARVAITNNSATNKGGGLVVSSYGKSSDAEVVGNTANIGGGIYMSGEGGFLSMDMASVFSNSATTGGGLHLDAGIVEFMVSDLGMGTTENIPDDAYIGGSFGNSFSGYSSNTSLVCDALLGSCL